MNDRLPPTARLQLHKIDDKIFQPQEYVPLLDLPSGRGLVYLVALAASSSSYQFWEGCIHLYTPHDEPFPGAENAFVEPLWALKNDGITKTGSEQTQEKVEGKCFFCRDATLHRHGGLLRYAYCFAHHDDNDMPTRANCLSAPFPRSKWTEACLLPFYKTRLGLSQSKELTGHMFHVSTCQSLRLASIRGGFTGQLLAVRTARVRKTASFLEFSLCLSRACLGKMIVFIYKWLKNAVFRRRDAERPRSCRRPGVLYG